MEKLNRSPFFYVGDKYKLLKQLLPLFPESIEGRFVEPFVGGGSVYLNTNYKNCLLNDSNEHVVKLHKFLSSFKSTEVLMSEAEKIIKKYNLSYSYKIQNFDQKLVTKFPKTYFAEMNRENYLTLRTKFNKNQDQNLMELYILMIYGFNRMLRFNSIGEFNIPVGNVDFNENVFNALDNYVKVNKSKNVKFSTDDFKDFFSNNTFDSKDLIYVDPPYLISNSEYNKYWTEDDDLTLYGELDRLNDKKIKFVLSNILSHKGLENKILKKWSKKYNLQHISSNYISYHDNSQKKSKEVVITNFNV